MKGRGSDFALANLTRELANAVRTSELPAEVSLAVQAQLEGLMAQLAPFRHPGPFACEQLRPPGQGFIFDMDDPGGSIPFAPMTGPMSPFAAKGRLSIVEGGVCGTLLFSPVHAGPMGLVHGGALGATFDEVMALATLAGGLVGYTRQMSIDYLSPALLDTPVEFQAKVTVAEGRDIEVRSDARQAGRTVATAHAYFRKISDLNEEFYATLNKRGVSDAKR